MLVQIWIGANKLDVIKVEQQFAHHDLKLREISKEEIAGLKSRHPHLVNAINRFFWLEGNGDHDSDEVHDILDAHPGVVLECMPDLEAHPCPV